MGIQKDIRGDVMRTRTVLVTGGSRGLGATIVNSLAQQGLNSYQLL